VQKKVSHIRAGDAEIDREFRDCNNLHFILHDSKGFEPGSDTNLKVVQEFVERRTKEGLELRDRLHAIWSVLSLI
jgi:hypothetical protein